MNIKIIDGYVTIDGTLKVSASYKLFTKEGIDICMPKDKQPTNRTDPANPYENVCRCLTPHVHFGPCIPKENRTMGRFDIATLLESLAKRLDGGGANWIAPILRAEKESWM